MALNKLNEIDENDDTRPSKEHTLEYVQENTSEHLCNNWDQYLDESKDFLKDKCITENQDTFVEMKNVINYFNAKSQEAFHIHDSKVRNTIQNEFSAIIKKYQ